VSESKNLLPNILVIYKQNVYKTRKQISTASHKFAYHQKY